MGIALRRKLYNDAKAIDVAYDYITKTVLQLEWVGERNTVSQMS